jgi:hypothetical protein
MFSDLRQHEIHLAIVAQFDDCNGEPELRLWVHPYEVLAVWPAHRDGGGQLLDAGAFCEVEIDAQPLRIEGVGGNLLARLIVR